MIPGCTGLVYQEIEATELLLESKKSYRSETSGTETSCSGGHQHPLPLVLFWLFVLCQTNRPSAIHKDPLVNLIHEFTDIMTNPVAPQSRRVPTSTAAISASSISWAIQSDGVQPSLVWFSNQSCYLPLAEGKTWIHIFPKGIIT